MDHATVMNSCDAKAQSVGITALTEIERVVVLVSRVNFEVELGGLSGFFSNSAGDHAVETISALEAVGAAHAAETLREAITSNTRGANDVDFDGDEPDVFARLCSYIDVHSTELREHG